MTHPAHVWQVRQNGRHQTFGMLLRGSLAQYLRSLRARNLAGSLGVILTEPSIRCFFVPGAGRAGRFLKRPQRRRSRV